jgi:DNA-binding Lrp family transcriptional regulator
MVRKAYVLLKVKAGMERNVVNNLKAFNEVVEINELYGEWDIILKVEVERFEEMDMLLTEKIRTVSGVEDTSTMIVAEYIR